jgi:hypothetical protein
MTEDPHVLLSALLDREPVDADALQHLLETPAGRTMLVDFVRLRSLMREEEPDAAAAPVLVRARWNVPRRLVLRGAAAMLVFAAGLAGGAWWTDRRDAQPPAPHRVVRFQPGVEWKSIAQE